MKTDTILERKARNDSMRLFFNITLFFLFTLFFVCFAYNPKGPQSHVFFKASADYMADFYNVAKFTADNNPYFNEFKGSYLPVSYIIFNILSRFSNYIELDAFTAGKMNMGLATSTYFMFIISAVFFLLLFGYSKGNRKTTFFTILALMLSGIFIFSLERGNLIILSALLTSFFIFNYNSSNKIMKEIAFICLAFAAALKAYPALLGILLIYEKRYKEAIRLIIYGIIAGFLPFIFIKGGFTNIPQLIKNLHSANDEYLFLNFPRFGYYQFVAIWGKSWTLNCMIPRETLNQFFSIFLYLLTPLALILNFREKTPWKKVGLIVGVIILFPVNSALYCGLYLFPIIVLFFNEQNHPKKDWFYCVLFILLLNPFQMPFWKTNLTTILANITVILLVVDIFISQIKTAVSNKRKERKPMLG